MKKNLVRLRNRVTDRFAIKCYSQEGEDIILLRIFADQAQGFYVDVGAHHPRRFSNTCLFYRQGWSGINIEPNPDAFREFQRDRPRDINLQIGVSNNTSVLKYYSFDEPALNTFDESVARSRLENTSYRLLGTTDIPVQRLDNLLREHLPAGKAIDFISIDVEGLDLAVLHSNDWTRFRPKVVLAEALNLTLEEVMQSEIFMFMANQGYVLFSKTYNTLIFRDERA